VHVPASAPPQTLGVPPPPHIAGAVQLPQWSRFPQPSPTGPQFAAACVQVRGTQGVLGTPQVFAAPPPPHVAGALQLPHMMMLPQPSAIGPQVAPADMHVRGTHTGPASTPVTAP
jgi:hypothetical protein